MSSPTHDLARVRLRAIGNPGPRRGRARRRLGQTPASVGQEHQTQARSCVATRTSRRILRVRPAPVGLLDRALGFRPGL